MNTKKLCASKRHDASWATALKQPRLKLNSTNQPKKKKGKKTKRSSQKGDEHDLLVDSLMI